MPTLTERQKTLLLVIIRDYIDAAQPVGSKRAGGALLPIFLGQIGMRWLS
jgi:hypothetical protein